MHEKYTGDLCTIVTSVCMYAPFEASLFADPTNGPPPRNEAHLLVAIEVFVHVFLH